MIIILKLIIYFNSNVVKTLKRGLPMNYMKRTELHHDKLTKGLKKVAEALLTDPIPFATFSAKKIASLLDVSETMVIRFCKAIGYDGYSELQKDVQLTLLSLYGSIDQPSADTNNNTFAQIMAMDQKNIAATAASIDWTIGSQIVEALVEAKQIKVVGYYHSFSYAHWFSFLLHFLLKNTYLYRPETDMNIGEKGKEHCLVIFSYYRYALDSLRLVEEAKQNGNTIIVITDSKLSPVAKYGDYVLNIQISQKSILEKGPVTFSVLNTLILHIAQKVQKLDFVNPTNKYYIE